MAFKGIEDRFKDKAYGLYRKYSTKDGSEQAPLLEWKPDDKPARETANDSRMLPVGSLKRDIARLGDWSKSGKGLLFLVKQEAQQTSNKFSETRIINPLFIVGNLVPGVHLKRALSAPSQFALSGDFSHKSPASDARMGAAGRLQHETSNEAISNLMGKGGRNNIFSYIPTPSVIKSLLNVFSMTGRGSLGIDQRPELDFNGTYFSIAVWNGFRKSNGFRDNLDAASANLRVGNLKGAWSSLKQSVRDVENQLRGVIPGSSIIPDGRNHVNSGLEGRRYFLTSPTTIDRYLKGSVEFSPNSEGLDHAFVNTSFFNRLPYVVGDVPTVNVRSTASKFVDKTSFLRSGVNQVINSTKWFDNSAAIKLASANLNLGELSDSAKTAEESMLFGELSLQNRYNTDDRLNFIKEQIQLQKNQQKSYWAKNRPDLAYNDSGYKPGDNIDIDPRVHKFGNSGNYSDGINTTVVASTVSKSGHTKDEAISLKKRMGSESLVNLWFFDFSKSELIPFRAYISGLTENINPEVNDTRYIGRFERNLVYMGATREVSFSLDVYAMSPAELKVIWEKIERLVGLCFPGGYGHGFMVPPFVKFTLGNLYNNQPCYIRSLTHNFEDGVSWDIDEGRQLPRGVRLNISLSLIENDQKRTGSKFYYFSRNQGVKS